MARQRDWSNLSPNYRARLERGGITRQSYEQGANLRAARGHAHTPERPTEGRNRPEFAEYYRRQATRYEYKPTPGQHSARVKQRLAQRIYDSFGQRFKFRGALDPDYPPPGKPGGPPYPPAPDDEGIMRTLDLSDDELEELAIGAAVNVTEYWFLWYH